MPFGFDCGDGWYNIIDQTCRMMQGHIDWCRRVRARDLQFNRVLKRAVERGDLRGLEWYYTRGGSLSDWAKKSIERDLQDPRYHEIGEKPQQVVAVQVKEKFGSLRFYVNGGDLYIRGMLLMAEALSGVTCEECGAPGKTYRYGWHRTLCPQHARAADYPVDENGVELSVQYE